VTILNYNHLRYFWLVAHEGNLTRAAEALGVSQSAVSVQIQKLENQLGQRLFERRGKQLVLTEPGRIALDHADTIFAVGRDLIATLKAQETSARRILRVGALATLSRNLQLQFLRPAIGRENVGIVVNSGPMAQLLALLEAHSIDVLLSNTVPPRDSATPWVPHRIAEQPVSLVGHPARVAEPAPLEELLVAHPLVLPSEDSSLRHGFDGLVERFGIRPTIAAEVDDMAMLRLLLRANDGLGVVPPIVVRDELRTGALVELARLPGLHETFYAIVMKRRFQSPVLKELLEVAAEWVDTDNDPGADGAPA
jgi:LysR family transcriptional activator of nhaA